MERQRNEESRLVRDLFFQLDLSNNLSNHQNHFPAQNEQQHGFHQIENQQNDKRTNHNCKTVDLRPAIFFAPKIHPLQDEIEHHKHKQRDELAWQNDDHRREERADAIEHKNQRKIQPEKIRPKDKQRTRKRKEIW